VSAVGVIEVSAKRKGEKVITIRLVLNEKCIIESAEALGDFFAVNPEALEEMLRDLAGIEATNVKWGGFLKDMARASGLYGVSRETLDSLAVKLAEEVSRACGEGVAVG
jgi:hypothetical protein